MEDLVQLLAAVQNVQRDSAILTPDTVLLESKGMQHWLNLELAKLQGVVMNYQFQMPSSFMWELARALLGTESIPKHSPYRGEVLAWRLDTIMSQADFITHPDCAQPCQYWAGDSPQPDTLKRFQLASHLASIFEQYMLFRPDWLITWGAHKNLDPSHGNIDQTVAQWQAWLWRRLVEQAPCHPLMLQQKAIEALPHYHGQRLPKQIMIFAINTMAPQTLAFFNALSAHGACNIHVFYLNPCVEFWGEVKSDKTQALHLRQQKITHWLDNTDTEKQNALLANLGQQGKAFFNLLQSVEGYEISAFDEGDNPSAEGATTDPSLLMAIQQDILTLSEAQQPPPAATDDSIVICSSHSALREIQALHDYLCHQFNQHPDWQARDVVVMCPAIEDYAPYIEAVFRRPWDEDTRRLPCSIADRTLMNAEPLIGTFIDLLQLPDSRFEINKILDYLHLPAIQAKFGFVQAELETIEWWLQTACVHWGRDLTHKKNTIGLTDASPLFTWQWGLERLLLGFAHSDTEVIDQHRLLLPLVEGQEAILLGRLMQLLERFKVHSTRLQQARTAEQWRQYLLELSDSFFQIHPEEQDADALIRKVINEFAENAAQADHTDPIDFLVMRHYLQHRFGLPDSGNHFLTGQITFCSMMPMRSIPFKVIAILGLNDGQFPRQNTPLSFDLMSQSQTRPGDRSRRGDDRYLFLEALISAREKLYLSYQGRDIHTNNVRQPSLVLTELKQYLARCYAWHKHTELPLHPFSPACYQGPNSSFDPHWRRVIEPGVARQNVQVLPPLPPPEAPIAVESLVKFFDNPLKSFATERLKLTFQAADNALEDTEPFAAHGLSEYHIREQFCHCLLAGQTLENARLRHQISGELPESPVTAANLTTWAEQATCLSQAIIDKGEITPETVTLTLASIQVRAKLPWLLQDKQLLLWRPSTRKAKDDVRLWLMHLLATQHAGQPIETHALFFADLKTLTLEWSMLSPLEPDQAKRYLQALLTQWEHGLCQPSLIHAALGKQLCQQATEAPDIKPTSPGKTHTQHWHKIIKNSRTQPGLEADAYFHWFYPEYPELTTARHHAISELYQPIYQHLQKVP